MERDEFVYQPLSSGLKSIIDNYKEAKYFCVSTSCQQISVLKNEEDDIRL